MCICVGSLQQPKKKSKVFPQDVETLNERVATNFAVRTTSGWASKRVNELHDK